MFTIPLLVENGIAFVLSGRPEDTKSASPRTPSGPYIPFISFIPSILSKQPVKGPSTFISPDDKATDGWIPHAPPRSRARR